MAFKSGKRDGKKAGKKGAKTVNLHGGCLKRRNADIVKSIEKQMEAHRRFRIIENIKIYKKAQAMKEAEEEIEWFWGAPPDEEFKQKLNSGKIEIRINKHKE